MFLWENKKWPINELKTSLWESMKRERKQTKTKKNEENKRNTNGKSRHDFI